MNNSRVTVYYVHRVEMILFYIQFALIKASFGPADMPDYEPYPGSDDYSWLGTI